MPALWSHWDAPIKSSKQCRHDPLSCLLQCPRCQPPLSVSKAEVATHTPHPPACTVLVQNTAMCPLPPRPVCTLPTYSPCNTILWHEEKMLFCQIQLLLIWSRLICKLTTCFCRNETWWNKSWRKSQSRRLVEKYNYLEKSGHPGVFFKMPVVSTDWFSAYLQRMHFKFLMAKIMKRSLFKYVMW